MSIPAPLETLKNTPPFSTLSEEVLCQLAGSLETTVYPRGTYAFRQGDPSTGFLFVVAGGLAEVTLTNEKGEENVLDYRYPFQFFGETGLDGSPYACSLRAVEDLTCLLVDRQTVESLMLEHPAFGSYFSSILTDRLRYLLAEVVAEQSYEAVGLEPRPFRKKLRDIMSAPVVTCGLDAPVEEVASLISSMDIGSVLVVDEAGRLAGIITEKDLVVRVLARGRDPRALAARDVMSGSPITLPPTAFFYEGLLVMVRNRVKHVPLVIAGQPVGIVSVRDLVRSRSTGVLTIVDEIESQDTIEGLNEARKNVDKVLQALISEGASASEICQVITEFNDRLTRKVIEMAETEMIREGFGPPPVQFCWLTMGSSGRKEQTLRTDQDNALIYRDPRPPEAETVSQYFLRLAGKVVDGLVGLGFPRCSGNVMASNPAWCRTLTDWIRTTARWFHVLDPDNVRLFTIFLDFRPVYGAYSLADELRASILPRFTAHTLHYLTTDDMNHRVPLGLFGRIVTERSGEHRGEIDLKRAVCVHLVDCVRIFALDAQVAETSTPGRLIEVREKGLIPADEAEFLEAAFDTLMMLRIRGNLDKISQGKKPDNYLNPVRLTRRERQLLREAMAATYRLQVLTQETYGLRWG